MLATIKLKSYGAGKTSREIGQSLIEVLVVLAVTVIIVTSLAAAVLISFKNAQFAQNQAKATKYAQEAMEIIQSIRERNEEIYFQGFAPPSFTGPFKDFLNFDISESNNSQANCTSLEGRLVCYFTVNIVASPKLQQLFPPNTATTLEGGFKREIFFENGEKLGEKLGEKKLTVKVKWADSSGEHESNLQTILTEL